MKVRGVIFRSVLQLDNRPNVVLKGMNTTAGSYALYKSIVPGDATVVAKLRKAGAVFLGKSNMVGTQVFLLY